jgi:hypothetical protein
MKQACATLYIKSSSLSVVDKIQINIWKGEGDQESTVLKWQIRAGFRFAVGSKNCKQPW